MLKNKITTIAFDADDTLWRNEEIFMQAQSHFIDMLTGYHDKAYIVSHLEKVQIRNISIFGYGVKGFTLSMIETAIELTEGRIQGHEIHSIIELSKAMLATPITLLPNVKETLQSLKKDYQLMAITKGDLLDQEGKFARSEIAHFFDYIEIVSEKKPDTYANLLHQYQINTDEFLMLGNSLKSDILPVLDIGAMAIHIPYHSTWVHEQVTAEELQKYPSIVEFSNISDVLPWLKASAKLP
ncbi:HAD family hydrolase [Marinomonas agarivorans]|nr:HAD family hydrolase [Marinomonas agarivorans]